MAIPARPLLVAAAALSLVAAVPYMIHNYGPVAEVAQTAAQPIQVAPAPNATVTVSSATVPIRDQARAKSFYVGKLGFSVVKETAGRLELTPAGGSGGATVVLSTQSGMQPGQARGLFWAAANCQSMVGALRARGVVIGDCAEMPSALFADFADPDGNVWTVLTSFDGGYANGTLANVGIPATDQDRAKAFYVEALGFTVVQDVPNPAPFPGRYIELAAPGGGTHIAVSTCPPDATVGPVNGMLLGSSNVSDTIKDLQARGVPVDASGNFTDPDGNGWSVVASNGGAAG